MVRQMLVMTAMFGLFAATGCYKPGGGPLPRTGDAQTLYSYETQPKSIRVIDLRTQKPIFVIDLPAGKQLTYKFYRGEGDDPINTPDLMRYQVFDMGTLTGSLSNSITMPPASSRRVDVYVTQEVQFRQPEPNATLRTDQAEDRPDWWTPEGGKMPDDTSKVTNYDG